MSVLYVGHWYAPGLFFDMISMNVCTIRHWQTSGRLVQKLNVCTVSMAIRKLLFHPFMLKSSFKMSSGSMTFLIKYFEVKNVFQKYLKKSLMLIVGI